MHIYTYEYIYVKVYMHIYIWFGEPGKTQRFDDILHPSQALALGGQTGEDLKGSF